MDSERHYRHAVATTHETHVLRRELQKMKRRRSDKAMLRMILFAPLVLYAAYLIGRSVFYMEGVKSFALTINSRPPPEVTADVHRYAADLSNPNPLIRNGAIAALKIATGWHYGADVVQWKNAWAANEPTWQYRRPRTNVVVIKPPAWLTELPATSTSEPPPNAP